MLSSKAVKKGSDKEGIWGYLSNDIRDEITRGSRVVRSFYFIMFRAPCTKQLFHNFRLAFIVTKKVPLYRALKQ